MKSGGAGKRILNIAAFILGLLAFFSTIWIILPAPSYHVWLFSVLASEWSLAFALVALFGIAFALRARFKTQGKLWFFSFILNLAALIISLYPVITAYQAANSQHTALSWREYFLLPETSDAEFNFTTRTFAVADGQELKIDIFSPPANAEKKGAGVVVVHGGSWSGGTRNDFPQWNRWLAENGYTVFDVDYRLTQPNWKTATGDVKCAVGWVRQNAAEFDISPDRVALLGRSAGGHLALLAAYSEGNAELPPSCSVNSQNKIRAVVSFYAPTDLIWDYDNPANQRVIDGPLTLRNLMGGSPFDSAEMRSKYLLASPVSHISPETAPTLLIHGGRDQLVLPQNMHFVAEKLKANGITNEEIFIPYAQHGFDFDFTGWGAQVVKPKILEFLNENLK